MIAITPLFLPALLGFLTSLHLVRKSSLRHSVLLSLILAIPLGLALCSLILFWSYVIGGVHGKELAFGSAAAFCILLTIPLIRPSVLKLAISKIKSRLADTWTNCRHPKGISVAKLALIAASILSVLLFLIVLKRYLDYYIGYSSWNVFGGWDAQYLWNWKARFLARSTEYWTAMFSPHIAQWILPDYPLMLPGSIAWGWISAGREILIWPVAVSLIFFLAVCFFLAWYLASYVSAPAGFLAGSYLLTIPSFQFWSTTQYADIALSFFFTAAAIFLLLACRTKEKGLFILSGLFTGLAAWTKNEGLLFLVWIALTLFIFLLVNRTMSVRDKKKAVACFLAGLLIPLTTVAYLKLVLGGGGIYLGSKRTGLDYLQLLSDFSRTKFIAFAFAAFKANPIQWKGLWFLFFLAILGWKKWRADYRWILLLLIFLIDLGYFAIYQITPIELRFHIGLSLIRLFFHNGALALIFAFEIFTPLSEQKIDPRDRKKYDE